MTGKFRVEGAPDTASTVAADRLRGVPKIAAFIGETERKTYYLLEKHLIPAAKEGAGWVSTRSALRDHYARLIRGTAA